MSLLLTEDRNGVRHLVLNRPDKRNALSGELIRELGAGIEAAAADDGVRVVVLRGEGAMFSSGMDVNDLRDLSEDPARLRDYRRPILSWWNLLEEMPKPTICQIHGAALGETTDAFAAELLACAPKAVGLAKRVMDAAAKPALALTLEQEVAAQETLAASEDFAEGARAFFEKRDPDFAGR